MDSPEKPNKSIKSVVASTTSPESAAFQDSPIFNYINNLSPIKPVKGTSVVQGFPGLNSPPLVFTSPRVNTYRQSLDLKRTQCHLKQLKDAPPKVADSLSPKGSMERHDKGNSMVKPCESPAITEKANDENELSPNAKAVFDGKDGSSSVESKICQIMHSAVGQTFAQQYNQFVAERMQSVQGYKRFGNTIGAGVVNESAASMMVPDLKAGQSQLGKRRRLQFEDTQQKVTGNDHDSQNPSNTAIHSRSPAISEVLDSSCADIPSTPSNMQLDGLSSTQNNRNASVTISKPSGIGLHLNSIVNARPLTCVPNVSIKSPEECRLSPVDNMKYHSISSNSNTIENVSAGNDEFTHVTPGSIVSYNNAKSMEVNERQEKQAERVEEFDRSNPKKKRKKSESSGDGCKRCNCKKTKCLKLYCDCFAAGIYCADSCSCQGCFNRPQYEATVLETRQHIEARNPLAFAPKIVPTQPPRSQSGEEGDQVTPLAGRHKRGCNCKKSMCLKKYCECYQVNVGCSDGCRCEGCQNIYGKKGVYGTSCEMRSVESINENLNDSSDDKLKLGSNMSRFSLPEFNNPHNLTPQTPSFQRSDHGKDSSKARLFPGTYLPSPESDCTLYAPFTNTPRSSRDSNNSDMALETNQENIEIVPFDPKPYPNVEFMDEFSPSMRAQILPLSSGSFSSKSSLSWRRSSATRETLVGGTEVKDSKEKLNDSIDDDTPMMLKVSSTLVGKVKVTSPNKKRVSPPRMRLHELGSSSLKSGRKFILKAVPSFPPLTPCIDSKDGTNQNTNDHLGDRSV